MRQAWIGILLAVAASFAAADTVVTKDGRELNGRIVHRDDEKVILEVSKYGANMQVALPRTDVVSVKESPVFKPKPTTKPATAPAPETGSTTRPASASYFVIPIKGEIGKDVQKDNVQEGMRIARIRKADYVVFEIDSPGGSVADTEEILNVMRERNDMRRVAIVSKALSSAAVLTMACTDVFMQPGATIGAAVPVPAGPNPQPLDEKVLSAIRAMARSSAEMGNHNVLLIQGMMEPDLELGLQVKDNKPIVEAGRVGKVIKEKGKILTLTAQESVACGLARDVVADDSEIGKSLGAAVWKNVTGTSKMYAEDVAHKQAAKMDKAEYLKSIQPQLEKLLQDLDKVNSDLEIAEANRAAMNKQYDAEMASAKAQLDQALRDASRFALNQSAGMQAQARAMYTGIVTGIQARYQGMGLNAQDAITKLTVQKNQLLQQKQKLLAWPQPRKPLGLAAH